MCTTVPKSVGWMVPIALEVQTSSSLLLSRTEQWPYASIFFFQAEDGIRDHCVTGVQMCALPIFERLHRERFEPARSVHDGAARGATIEAPRVARRDSGGNAGTTGRAAAGLVSPLAGCAGDRDRRSEERRVGKGGGSGG